jgi:hypothetical protein
MEIKEVLGPAAPIFSRTKREQSPSSGADFQTVLEGATLNRNTGDKKAQPIGPGQGIEAGFAPITSAAVNVLFGVDSATRTEMESVNAAERVIDLMERYRHALADPGTSLKSIEPLIQSLSQETGRLSRLSEILPCSESLREITTEAGIVSSLEIEKFYRGDYVG